MDDLGFPFFGKATPYHKVVFSTVGNKDTDARQISNQFDFISVDRKTTENSIELYNVNQNNTTLA